MAVTTEWYLVRSAKEFGNWKPKGGSPNTKEDYCIKPQGTWVPAIDWGWLKEFRKHCPCGGNRRMRMFYRVTPTADQLALKPKRSPMLRASKKSNFGLQHIKE